ncbi:MAG: DUF2188 domain-containing protein [bacterium]|nr:DUF2188 domain-containing protein [bacterium]
MANRKVLHVVPNDNQWGIKGEGSGKIIKLFPTKPKAVNKAREMAKNNQPSQVVIHKENGRFQEERTYKEDPFPPKG